MRLRRCHCQRTALVAGLVTLGLLLTSLRWTLRESQLPAEDSPAVSADETLVPMGSEPGPARPDEVAVVVLAARRPEVQLLVRQLLATRPAGFRILVSQDGAEPSTTEALGQLGPAVTWLRFSSDRQDSYARISQHHRHVLDRVFLDLGFRHAILMEDDLVIAPDFYAYFGALRSVLDGQPGVFCVSAWNDNGLVGLVEEDATLLHRTDFFPGLGWMISRAGWLRVRGLWPDSQFDDFLRKYMLREGLVCIRPEVPRTFNTGRCWGREVGILDSYGREFYHRYLSRIALNHQNISLPASSISRIMKRSADEELQRAVRSIPEVELASLLSAPKPPPEARLRYGTAREYVALAKQIGIIPEVWFGAPRASILGIVTISLRGCRVFIVPDSRLPFSDVIVSAADDQWTATLLVIWGIVLLSAGCLLALANRLVLRRLASWS